MCKWVWFSTLLGRISYYDFKNTNTLKRNLQKQIADKDPFLLIQVEYKSQPDVIPQSPG